MLVGQPNSESPGDVSIYQKNMLNFYYVSTMYIGSNYEQISMVWDTGSSETVV